MGGGSGRQGLESIIRLSSRETVYSDLGTLHCPDSFILLKVNRKVRFQQ